MEEEKCCGWNVKCPLKAHVFKHLDPSWRCCLRDCCNSRRWELFLGSRSLVAMDFEGQTLASFTWSSPLSGPSNNI